MKNSKQLFKRGLLSCMVAALAMGFAIAQEEEPVDPVINDYSTLFADVELTRAIFKQATPTPTDPSCPWGIFKSRMNHANGFGLTDGTGSYGETVADGFSSNVNMVWLKADGTFASGKPSSIYYAITMRYKNITSEASWYKFSMSAQYTSGDAMHLTLLYLNPASDNFEKVLSFHRIDLKIAESTAETFFVYMPAGSAVYIAANADRQDGYADFGKYDYVKVEAVNELPADARVFNGESIVISNLDYVGGYASAIFEEKSYLLPKELFESLTPLEIASDKVYYIYNKKRSLYWGGMNADNSDILMQGDKNNAGKYAVIKSADGEKSYLYDVVNKAYVSTPTNTTNGDKWMLTNNSVNAVYFETVKPVGTGRYEFKIKNTKNNANNGHANPYNQEYIANGNWNNDDQRWYLEMVDESPVCDLTHLNEGDVEGLIAMAAENNVPMTYTATVSAAGYSTLCVPFDAELPADSEVEVYSLTDVADGAVQGEKVSSVEANKPVLLKNEGTLELTSTAVVAPESTVNGLLTGVYASEVIPEGSYVLQKQNEEVAFFRVGATQPTVVPFRAYLTVPNNEAPVLRIGGATTGVESMSVMENQPSVVYDMMGREVASPVKGIYIVNGKKMVIK